MKPSARLKHERSITEIENVDSATGIKIPHPSVLPKLTYRRRLYFQVPVVEVQGEYDELP